MTYQSNLQRWMDWIEKDHTEAGLAAQLAEDVVFYSPVVHTPQKGKAITMAYLMAAGKTLGNESFNYARVFDCGHRAVLEFETLIEGLSVNGVDIIEWNSQGMITEFKVMVRPLKGVQIVHAQMRAMLERMQAGPAPM